MFRLLVLAILAVSFSVVCAQPINEARANYPSIYGQSGRLRIIGVGSTNKSFNQTVAYDRSGTLALGDSPNGWSLVVSHYDQHNHHTIGYIRQGGEDCLEAHTDTGRTKFFQGTCADAAYPSASKEQVEETRRRQTFTFKPSGGAINIVSGDAYSDIPVRPNVRVVGNNEIHTTPGGTDHIMQLFLQPF